MSEATQMTSATEQPLAQAQSQETGMLQTIRDAAMNPDVNPEKMERMYELYKDMQAENAKREFHAAMTAAQSEMGRVSADATNPQTRSKYASYAALDKALRPIYSRHGLALSFDTDDAPKDDYVRVLCHVSHASGHCRTYRADMPADGKGAKGGDVMTKTHAAGSAMSYGMRYLLKLIFNVAVGEDDDDGNAASAPVKHITKEQAADLQSLAEEVGANTGAFLKYMSTQCKRQITSFGEIPETAHKLAVSALEAKRKGAK